jgi:hypothetical protein
MAFVCPECATPQGLQIKASIELPPDSRSDEITVQVVECSRCSFVGIAVYEESRRGGLDRESYSHVGYRAPPQTVKDLRQILNRCPRPRNTNCECYAHSQLGTKDSTGRWSGLSEYSIEGEFELLLLK